MGHQGVVRSVAFLPDGKTLLSSSSDNTIRIWRVADGALLHTYDHETVGVNSLAVAPDGKSFAFGRDDGTVLVARTPLWISALNRDGGQFTATWQGGSGLYQPQIKTNFSSGTWQNLGEPTTATTVIVPASTGGLLFRVQSVAN
jgi:WD40 repeat protein